MSIKDIWVSIGIDPIKPEVFVMGFADSKLDALTHVNRLKDITYFNVFNLDNLKGMFVWFLACGIPEKEAKFCLRKMIEEICKTEILSPE